MTADANIVELVKHQSRPRNPYLPVGWLPFPEGPSCDPVVIATYVRVWERRAAAEHTRETA